MNRMGGSGNLEGIEIVHLQTPSFKFEDGSKG
jgi:hypothetical protein